MIKWKHFLLGVVIGSCLSGMMMIALIKISDAKMAQSIKKTETKNTMDYEAIESKIKTIHSYVDNYYLYEGDKEVDYESGIYKGVVEALEDPYSVYYTPTEYKEISESTEGVFYGIGATVQQDPTAGTTTIINVVEDGPADKAGVQSGDVVYKINDEDVTALDLSEIVSKMRGDDGTKVKITFIRKGKEVTFDITRGKVETTSAAGKMLDEEEKIGYIYVSEFDENTPKQFRSAMADLESQGMKGLVIDLRNNGGGRLDAAVDMADYILPAGRIVSTKTKNGEESVFDSTDKESLEMPLAIVINGHSASASEVFAGAIQDHKSGVLVGEKSFGKGIVQSVFGMTDGSALKLTTSEYFTPSGRNIQGEGLTPDVEVELNTEELMNTKDATWEDDNQVSAAVSYVESKLGKNR
ncbi:MAG: S41 family peptidase [Lachnospiraceae bacterium]|nr:S41 family peptidase [Lachnospiraceae bacterium]